MITTLQDFLAHFLGFLGPYRINIRVPVGDNDWALYTYGAFTEAQGLRLLHNMGYPGTLSKRGRVVALRAGSDALKN